MFINVRNASKKESAVSLVLPDKLMIFITNTEIEILSRSNRSGRRANQANCFQVVAVIDEDIGARLKEISLG